MRVLNITMSLDCVGVSENRQPGTSPEPAPEASQGLRLTNAIGEKI